MFTRFTSSSSSSSSSGGGRGYSLLTLNLPPCFWSLVLNKGTSLQDVSGFDIELYQVSLGRGGEDSELNRAVQCSAVQCKGQYYVWFASDWHYWVQIIFSSKTFFPFTFFLFFSFFLISDFPSSYVFSSSFFFSFPLCRISYGLRRTQVLRIFPSTSLLPPSTAHHLP